ncbi:MAG: TatD family hydrolase [Candidatus Dadabacteria bacterium]|nr:TatD family hydrolase [Candidatus Dadabacteria bacterium]
MLVDSHAHLLSIEDPVGAVSKAAAEGVGKIISIGTGIESSLATIEFSRKYRGVYVSVGIHPHSASSFNEEVMREFEGMAEDPKVVAIGETGLDYHYMNSPREDQIRSFEAHMGLARRRNLPFVVHVRDAEDELLSMLRGADLGPVPGVIHCFSGDYETAKKYLDLGFFISFSGIVTFKRAEEVRDAAARIPIERLLYETDSPYLAPVPQRGKPNEPCNVVYVARLISKLRGLSLEEFTQIVFENVTELFPKVSNDKDGLI